MPTRDKFVLTGSCIILEMGWRISSRMQTHLVSSVKKNLSILKHHDELSTVKFQNQLTYSDNYRVIVRMLNMKVY